MIRFLLVFILSFTSITGFANTRKLLESLDFSSGRWVMIGVSLHNYQTIPVQQEVGTFIVKEPVILKKIQEKWIFEELFDDYCEYHYALKFYKDGELQLTLRCNLLCNYITLGGFSYEFDLSDFEEFKRYYTPIKWSRIRFTDLSLMQTSVDVLDKAPGVYWYGDVNQFNFDGHFTITRAHYPWNADRDSLKEAITDELQDMFDREDIYVNVWVWYLSDDWEEMEVRFNVYCNQDFFDKYKKKYDDIIVNWRNHFYEQNFVQLVVIGLNREDYYKLMGQSDEF